MFLLYEIYIHVQFTLRIKNPLYISGKMFLFTQEADGGEREFNCCILWIKAPFLSSSLYTHTHIKRYTYTKYICTIQLYTHILCEYVHIFKCTYVQYSYTLIYCVHIFKCVTVLEHLFMDQSSVSFSRPLTPLSIYRYTVYSMLTNV